MDNTNKINELNKLKTIYSYTENFYKFINKKTWVFIFFIFFTFFIGFIFAVIFAFNNKVLAYIIICIILCFGSATIAMIFAVMWCSKARNFRKKSLNIVEELEFSKNVDHYKNQIFLAVFTRHYKGVSMALNNLLSRLKKEISELELEINNFPGPKVES